MRRRYFPHVEVSRELIFALPKLLAAKINIGLIFALPLGVQLTILGVRKSLPNINYLIVFYINGNFVGEKASGNANCIAVNKDKGFVKITWYVREENGEFSGVFRTKLRIPMWRKRKGALTLKFNAKARGFMAY